MNKAQRKHTRPCNSLFGKTVRWLWKRAPRAPPAVCAPPTAAPPGRTRTMSACRRHSKEVRPTCPPGAALLGGSGSGPCRLVPRTLLSSALAFPGLSPCPGCPSPVLTGAGLHESPACLTPLRPLCWEDLGTTLALRAARGSRQEDRDLESTHLLAGKQGDDGPVGTWENVPMEGMLVKVYERRDGSHLLLSQRGGCLPNWH